MTNCLEECITNHDSCRANVNVELPTRVVNVGDSSVTKSRLYEPPSGAKDQYLALSYCWGKGATILTTSTTLESHIEGLDPERIPRTIADAITVTRRLGFRYLWVDALCILQGDGKAERADWEKESARMDQYYGNSHLLLSAMDGYHCDDGMLHARTATVYYNPGDADHSEKRLNVSSLTFWPWEERYSDRPPITSRGWTLQEHLLPPRMIAFTRTSTIWECNEVKANDHYSRDPQPQEKCRESYWNSLQHDDPQLPLIWNDIVIEFCRRGLTNPHDKLSAISGLAGRYQKVCGAKYFAGSWDKTLITDLLWARKYEGSSTPMHTYEHYFPAGFYRAPTWPWASMEGHIKYPEDLLEQDHKASILSCSVDLANPEDSFGRIFGGNIVVRGHVVSIRLNYDQDSRAYRLYLSLHYDTMSAFAFATLDWDIKFEDWYGSDENRDKHRLCILLVQYYGLVIEPVEGGKTNVYRRVGRFELSEEDVWYRHARIETVTIV
ncbi:heterokaryon incompatibility protein [Rutstroemia sp. NJR-2017a BBW]|nr:heterokaryon incompatibility protein [Rutstroemia sp. NJR-2017a BBW]